MALVACAVIFLGLLVFALVIEWPIPSFMEKSISRVIEWRLGATMRYSSGTFTGRRGVDFYNVVFIGPRGDSVAVDSATASFSILQLPALLTGHAPVTSLTVSGLKFAIVRDQNGRFILPIEPPQHLGRFDVRLKDAQIRYRDVPLNIDHTMNGIRGVMHLGKSIEGECEGMFPQTIGGRWILAAKPAGAERIDFNLVLIQNDARETGQAKGVVERESGGAFSGDGTVEISARFGAQFLQRRLPATGLLRFAGHAECGNRTFVLDGDLRADSLVAGYIPIADLRGRMTANEKEIIVRNATARVLGGNAAISSASASFSNLDAWTASGKIDGADAGRATKGRLGTADLRGTFSCEFNVRGAPSAPYDAIGEMRLVVAGGTINAPALDRLVRLSGDPSLKPLHFNRLSARLGLRANGLSVDRLDFSGPRIDARGSARVAANRSLSGEVTFLLSQELTNRIVGPLGASLPRKGERTVVPAKLGGTLDNPTVDPLVGAMVAGTAYGIARSVAQPVGAVANKVSEALHNIFGNK